MSYNLTLYNNASGIMGIFEATNYMTNGILAILLICSIALLSFWVLTKNNNDFAISAAVTSFGTLLLSLLLRVREFSGSPVIPDWFVITILIINAFSVAALFMKPR